MNHVDPDKVISFLSQQLSIPMHKLNENYCLSYDLGVVGDDAVELIEEYSKKFNVDISEFTIEEYFLSEEIFTSLGILNGIAEKEKEMQHLKVQDLIEAVETGKLQ